MNVNNLKTYKDEILKAEIGSLLFNLGKTHIGFWKEKKNGNGNKIIYFNVDEDDSKDSMDINHSVVIKTTIKNKITILQFLSRN